MLQFLEKRTFPTTCSYAAVRIDAREHGTWIKVPKGHAKNQVQVRPLINLKDSRIALHEDADRENDRTSMNMCTFDKQVYAMSMFILTFKRFNHENVHTYVGQI